MKDINIGGSGEGTGGDEIIKGKKFLHEMPPWPKEKFVEKIDELIEEFAVIFKSLDIHFRSGNCHDDVKKLIKLKGDLQPVLPTLRKYLKEKNSHENMLLLEKWLAGQLTPLELAIDNFSSRVEEKPDLSNPERPHDFVSAKHLVLDKLTATKEGLTSLKAKLFE